MVALELSNLGWAGASARRRQVRRAPAPVQTPMALVQHARASRAPEQAKPELVLWEAFVLSGCPAQRAVALDSLRGKGHAYLEREVAETCLLRRDARTRQFGTSCVVLRPRLMVHVMLHGAGTSPKGPCAEN